MPILEKEPTVFPGQLFEPSFDAPSDSNWWAVFTKSRQEKALARDLLAQDVPFFLPLVTQSRPVRGRKVQSYSPLFTGYVFLYANEDQRLASLKTNRITMLLPAPDNRQMFDDLRNVHTLIESEAPLTVEKRLMPGQRVRIKSGPMMGLEGTVTARRGKLRLLVAVHFLQSGVSVEIDDYMVEPLS